jgi:hypothetical protein
MTLAFDLHGRVGMSVADDVPGAPQLRDMFAPFRTEGEAPRPAITIASDLVPLDGAVDGDDELTYNETGLLLRELGIQILQNGDDFALNGRRELLTSVLPLLDVAAVRGGAAMIHAATIAVDGCGICMPAWGGAGKTSTVAKLVRTGRAAFLGDDWAFVSPDGELLAYEKPMLVKPHHRALYPSLFSARRRKPLAPSSLTRPLGRIATAVHPTISRYPRVARLARRLSPEHLIVPPRAAFPDGRFATSAPLALAVFVERWDGSRIERREVGATWMASRLLGNFFAELPATSHVVLRALTATGIVPLEDHLTAKSTMLTQGLCGVPCHLLRMPRDLNADDASDAIVAALLELLDVTLQRAA